jgi:peptide/nickel transport system substrate-binding protein
MNETKRNWGRGALYVTVAGAMMLALVPAGAHHASAQATSRKIGDHDVAGRFLEVWNAAGAATGTGDQGSTYVNGLPLTDVQSEISTENGKAYDTQWFERAKYEAHPENQAPYDVLLGRLGATLVEGRGSVDPASGQVRNPADAAFVGIDQPGDISATKLYFPETKHSVSGIILQYWNQYGGLQQFGYPLSEAFDEISDTDGKTYNVQYFERARFETHPEKAAPYEVELGLLGVQQYKQTPIAASDLPIAPIKGQTTSKDSITIGSSQEPEDLTVFNNAAITVRILALLDHSLTYRDENSKVFPELAWYVPTLENGGASYVGTGDDRHLVAKYKLRQGVKWSDGTEVTSNDAVFYFKLIMNPDAPVVTRSEYQKLENVDNPDKYTVIYNWRSLNQLKAYYNSIPNQADYSFLKVYIDAGKPAGSLTYSEIGGIYPQHALESIAPADIRTAPFASAPVGMGPYVVTKWDKGQEMDLAANPNYNLTDQPLIKNITIKFITDVNQLIAQVKTGDLDLVFSEAFNNPPADKAGIEAAGYQVVSRPATTWEHIDFYFEYPPFQDLKVRQAIMQGINRQRVSDVVYAGTAGLMNTVTPPLAFHSLDNPDFKTRFPDIAAKYPLDNNNYNPDNAKALLDSAGWVDSNGDGVRDKDGVELSFEYGTTTQAARQQIQALVSADLKAIGVDAQTKNYPAGTFFAGDDTDPRATGQTKFQEFAYIGSTDSDYSSWTCDQRWNPTTFAGANNQQYCNHDLDEANGQYNAASSDQEIADASAHAQQILANDVVSIPLVERANIEIVSNKLQNFKETNSQYPSTYNVNQWAFK